MHPAPHTLDTARLDPWFRAHVSPNATVRGAEKFAGGQSNPTFRIDTDIGAFVLRRKPPGELLASAHAVDREFRVLSALAKTDVPVPRVYALCADTSVIGSMFYVMEHLDGRVFWDPTEAGDSPTERAAIFEAMGDTIAKLHSVDVAAVGLADYGRTGGYMARQIARWTKQYRASETEPQPAMDALIGWLAARPLAEGDTALVHGDFRLDNLIFAKDAPRVIGVLDWELSTLGDPLADFAYNLMAWRFEPDLFRGFAGLDLGKLGIPSEADYVAAYCRRTGRAALPDLDTYVVFSMFRIAALLQGVLKRALDGNASSAEALETGARGRRIAERAWEIAQRLD